MGDVEISLVPGHEAIGKITALGEDAKFLKVGQTVGLGWNSGSCLHSALSFGRSQHVPKPGANHYREAWCFNPLVQFAIRPTESRGVVGIGGLGHVALQFLNKWGCHVTAFITSDSKVDEARKMGARDVVNTKSRDQLKKLAGSLNLVLSTVLAELDMNSYISALAPKGRFHKVGVIPKIQTGAFPLIAQQRSISGSPSGAPGTVVTMLDFWARHGIAAITEEFPVSRANEALEHLEAGKARYRVVLKNDLK